MLFGLFKLLGRPSALSTAPSLSDRMLPILGQNRRVICLRDLIKKITITEHEIVVSDPRQNFKDTLEEGLKAHLKKTLEPLCISFSNQLDVKIHKISIRNTRSRWGSCSSRGNLSFCWRLIFAPHPVVAYLAAHEVSHLKHMNHSPAFWQTVAQLDPDYMKSRRWLREHGHTLMSIVF